MSTTNHNIDLNSDHLPIQLHIPPNTLIAKIPSSKPEPLPRILNPIPKENLENFHTKFFETNSNQLNDLAQLLKNHTNLTTKQLQSACTSLETLIANISNTVLETCTTPPAPILPDKIAKQEGYLPKKLKKQWKKLLTTYHLIRKTIYITKNNPNWRDHPIIQETANHTHNILLAPPPRTHPPTRHMDSRLGHKSKNSQKKSMKIYNRILAKKNLKTHIKIPTII